MKVVRIKTKYNETFLAECLNFKTIQRDGAMKTNKGYIPIEEIEDFEIVAE